MDASELAFLALGLILGAGTGAGVAVAVRSRLPRREVLLTVTHDAVRKRASTLSSEGMLERPTEPAPGGPGDRRQTDRDDDMGGLDRRQDGAAGGRSGTPLRDRGVGVMRTPVRSGAAAVGIAIEPEPDRALEFLRTARPPRPLVERILRGDHRAMLTALDTIAGEDGATRRTWEELLTELVEVVNERAIDLGILDFPMSAPFWDTFTVEQCRRIAGALGSMGYRFDGREAWEDGRAPSYRDLSSAVSEAGVDPRRVRAWPNQHEIAELYRGARPAPDEAVATYAPTLDPKALHEFLGPRSDGLADLWLTWEPVRRLLLEPVPVSA